jgi:hypothetical protein
VTSIVEDFVSLSAELSKLEQINAPQAEPDLSNSGDVTDEARNTFYAMYGFPVGGSVEAAPIDIGVAMSIEEAIAYCRSKIHKSFRFTDWADYEAGC